MTPKASNRGPAIEDGGRLLTVARSIGPTGVGAEVLAYENWPRPRLWRSTARRANASCVQTIIC